MEMSSTGRKKSPVIEVLINGVTAVHSYCYLYHYTAGVSFDDGHL
jgi:hypothetical protein